MRNAADIEIILDENYADPKVTIRTRTHSKQVENIVWAIENAAENEYPMIPGLDGDKLELLSQRDIVRVYRQGRKVMVQTDKREFVAARTLTGMEELLNPDRFIRISQSEIVNLYKVKCFSLDMAGTIGIEFENGVRSWAARSRVRELKSMLREYGRRSNPPKETGTDPG
ncbi:MAG: LytTR family transcriptional regulator DNA-binding domain-containing protein [Lachnospiraceae bacterium]|nr:LytTR family transcriptional regulator DNA-binding domain-containing protein [Lachnospiraceae bacterium]